MGSINTRTSLTQAKAWIDCCESSHTTCKAVGGSSWKPTRLLEIGSPASDHVRLSNGIDLAHDQYVTLSHCWGNRTLLCLTKLSEPVLREGIRISKLPKSFEDAIHIAEFLGVKYLWIDALCIFQDSQDDWRRESSVMGQIYRNGLFNIGATTASNSSQGIFREREGLILHPNTIKTAWTDHPNYELSFYTRQYLANTLIRSPLLYRGWVLQEYYMSRRFLHFTQRELIWECNSLMACESLPEGFYPDMHIQRFKPQNNVLEGPHSEDVILSFWCEIVERYSDRALTKESDRLVAISSIARELSKILGNNYVAGLWSNDLIPQLLWSTSAGRARYEEYIAPSWSWASINWHVTMHKRKRTEVQISEVIEVSTQNVADDIFGQVKSGFIRLRGFLGTCVLHEKRVRLLFAQSIVDHRELLLSRQWDSIGMHINSLLVDLGKPDGNVQQLHIMPLLAETIGEFSSLTGLLLEASGVCKGQFRRYGTVRLSFKVEWGKDITSQIASWLRPGTWTPTANHDWMEYEDFDGASKYTISII